MHVYFYTMWFLHLSLIFVLSRSAVSNSLWSKDTRLLCPQISQARILEWVAISFSRASSQPMDQTWFSCTAGRFLTIWAIRETHLILLGSLFVFSFTHKRYQNSHQNVFLINFHGPTKFWERWINPYQERYPLPALHQFSIRWDGSINAFWRISFPRRL